MTSLKHYHLGCGESLQSNWAELQKLITKSYEARAESKRKPMVRAKQGKRH